jgi:hypothetical protein
MEKSETVMKIIIKNCSGESVTVSVYPEDTIQDLKNRIQDEIGIPFDFSQMSNNGQKVTDDQKVVDYISNG